MLFKRAFLQKEPDRQYSTGMTSRPIPSPEIKPMVNCFLLAAPAAVAKPLVNMFIVGSCLFVAINNGGQQLHLLQRRLVVSI